MQKCITFLCIKQFQESGMLNLIKNDRKVITQQAFAVLWCIVYVTGEFFFYTLCNVERTHTIVIISIVIDLFPCFSSGDTQQMYINVYLDCVCVCVVVQRYFFAFRKIALTN